MKNIDVILLCTLKQKIEMKIKHPIYTSWILKE
jgi:hypothetical protein